MIRQITFEAPQTYLHNVFHQWCPAGELIGLLAHALLPVQLLSSAEGGLTEERGGGEDRDSELNKRKDQNLRLIS